MPRERFLAELTTKSCSVHVSAPGDGLPRLSMEAAVIEGIETLLAIDEQMGAGMKIPMGFNRGPQVFLAKGDGDSDEPEDTERWV